MFGRKNGAVFSNREMSLDGECGSGSFGGLLSGIFSYMSRRSRGGGNVGIGFIDFQGLREGRKTGSGEQRKEQISEDSHICSIAPQTPDRRREAGTDDREN